MTPFQDGEKSSFILFKVTKYYFYLSFCLISPAIVIMCYMTKRLTRRHSDLWTTFLDRRTLTLLLTAHCQSMQCLVSSRFFFFFFFFFFFVDKVFESFVQNFECFSCIIGSLGIHISDLQKYITPRPKSVAKRKKKGGGGKEVHICREYETCSHKWATSHQGTKGDMGHWTFQKSIENKGIFQGNNGFLTPNKEATMTYNISF